MFDWNDLRYFLAVAREGSTIGAANALRVNQSTVQRRLAALEEVIESQLVERTPTGYRLTEKGLALRPHAEAVENAVEAFRRQLASIEDAPAGTIRVTAPEGIAYLILTPLLETFHTRHPSLKVDVILTDQILDLSKGDADVALRVAPLEDSVLIGRKISDQAWGFYASRAYAERHGTMSCPDDINRHAVILLDRELADIQVSTWLRGVMTDAKVAARCNSVSGALLTAKTGVGVAMLPSHIGDTEAGLVRMFGPLKGIASGIYLVAHPDLHKTPRVRAFFDFMIQEIEQFRPLLAGKT
jgi:DNA-binding transcriptional LysR family regulator